MKPRRMFAVVEQDGTILCVNRTAKQARDEGALYVPASVEKTVAWKWALKHGYRVRPVIVSPERKP